MKTPLEACIEACRACAAACDHCAVSCLGEEHWQHLRKCIRLDIECAELCRAAATLLSLGSEYAASLCEICAAVCNACADECGKHDHEHCRRCAEACRKCAEACQEMAGIE